MSTPHHAAQVVPTPPHVVQIWPTPRHKVQFVPHLTTQLCRTGPDPLVLLLAGTVAKHMLTGKPVGKTEQEEFLTFTLSTI